MSKLDELIAELCPDGVEYKSIGEVCDFRNGFAFKSSKFKNNGEPILRISNIRDGKIDTNNLAYFDLTDYAEDLSPYIVNKGDIVVAMSGATTGKIGINDTDNIYYLNQRVGKFIPNEEIILNKLLYHILTSKTDLIYQLSGGGAQPNVSPEKLKKIKIPVPPLPVQQEIVRILDNFTELKTQLTTELKAEIEARKKQYEYYRDYLLTFDGQRNNKVKWMTLKEVCKKISSGGTPNTNMKEYYNGNVPWLRTQEVNFNEIYDTEIKITEEGMKNSSAKWIPENCVIVALYGATAAKVAINKIPLTTNQACCNLQIDGLIANYRYVFHWLSSQYRKLKALGQGSQSNINAKTVKEYPIPVPPLEEQERIVAILDRFDALCNDLTSGIPAEIEARQKQYEYYRDKLLTFPARSKDVKESKEATA